MTASPTRGHATSLPTETTVPDTSRPGMSVTPEGAGYFPSRWRRSGRFTPAAETLMRTSEDPSLGMSQSTTRSTSAPPGSAISTAFIRPVSESANQYLFLDRDDTTVLADRIEHRIHLQHHQPRIPDRERALHRLDGARIFAEGHLDGRDPVGRESVAHEPLEDLLRLA